VRAVPAARIAGVPNVVRVDAGSASVHAPHVSAAGHRGRL